MVLLNLTRLIYGQLVISVIGSYCLYGHFSLDKTMDHISDLHCNFGSFFNFSQKGLAGICPYLLQMWSRPFPSILRNWIGCTILVRVTLNFRTVCVRDSSPRGIWVSQLRGFSQQKTKYIMYYSVFLGKFGIEEDMCAVQENVNVWMWFAWCSWL